MIRKKLLKQVMVLLITSSFIVPWIMTGRLYASAAGSTGVYDFNSLNTGLLDSQDNWKVVPTGSNGSADKAFQILQPGITVPSNSGTNNAYIPGHDGSKAARFPFEFGNVGCRASRVNDSNFSFPALSSGDIYVIEFEMLNSYWSSAFGLGYDKNSNRDIDDTEIGLSLQISNGGLIRRLQKPNGTVVNGTNSPALGNFNRYQVVIDRLANNGQGSASVWFLNLDTAGSTWKPITGLQNINMGFDTSASKNNPLNWNGMRIFSESAGPSCLFDNITFRVVTPSMRTVNFGDTGFGSSSSPQTISLDGANLSGGLTATLTGDYMFTDNSTQIQNVTKGSILTLKFVPSGTGARNGTLTLRGNDMAAPFTIPLSGKGITNITAAGITGIVAPAAGAAPEAAGSLSAEAAGYTVTGLTWQNGDGSPATLTAEGKFSAGSSYQAMIELTAAAGHKFQALTPTVDAGMAAAGTVNADAEGNKLTFIVTFSATAIKTVTKIDIANQPAKLIYTEGTDGALALNGMAVTETYNDGTTGTVSFTDGTAAGYTANPANGTTLTRADHNNTPVTVGHTASGKTTQTSSLTVNPAPTYGISLDKAGTVTFAGQTVGYGSVTPLTVTVSNTGNQATGDLTATLSGTNPGSYTLSKATIPSIAAGGSDTFTVTPNTGLSAGTYTATVTVSGSHIAAQAFTVSFAVDPAPVVNATVSPDAGSFDKYVPADVQTAITWGSATGVSDIKSGGISIGATNYSVSGNTLTIKKAHLAAQTAGSLVLTVEFDAGTPVTLTITIADTTPPTISPALCTYDLSSPGDVVTNIEWNSAMSVATMVYSVAPVTTPYTLNTDDYTVTHNDLIIKNSFFSGLSLTAGAALDFYINFNTGASVALAVHVVDSHVPSSNADLSSLSVNGTPVNGFDPAETIYNVELPYGSLTANVTATTDDPLASRIITDTPFLPGSATVTVTAEDGITKKTYTINFTIGAPPPVATYVINASAGSDGGISPGGIVSVTSGGSQVFTILPDLGYRINAVIVDGIDQGVVTTYIFTNVTANHTIIATFTRQSDGGGGYGSGGASVPPPAEKTITVTETSSALFSGNAGEISVSANMDNAFSNSVEVKVTDTSENKASFKLGAGDEVFPFDISLYVKDTNKKMQPAPGYAVTISLPVPNRLLDRKELLSVMHKSDSGVVTTLTSRLEQRNGVWYLTFEATEFSPYALVIRNIAAYDESVGLPYYLDANGGKVFIGFAANGKYLAPTGVTILYARNDKGFKDVSGHWAAPYIGFVTERELFLGTSRNTFSPSVGITRAMFATIIGRLYERSYGEISPLAAHAFTDCDYCAYYGKYVDWAAENKIISGYGNGKFHPGDAITREQMSAILYLFSDFLGVLPSSMDTVLDYPDAGSISDYAKTGALYCQTTGIIVGNNSGMFAPRETATRAEVATIIQRFIEFVVK